MCHKMRRKHHGSMYYACDWTGLPLSSNKCFCPIMKNNKMCKFGSFMNWECVVAYIDAVLGPECAATEQQTYSASGKLQIWKDTLEKVHELAGYLPKPAPPFTSLVHFGGETTAAQYMERSKQRSDTLVGILVSPTGEVTEIKIEPISGLFHDAICKIMEVGRFDSVHVSKKLKLHKGRQLVLLNDLQVKLDGNQHISTYFKNLGVQMFGNVVLLAVKTSINQQNDYFVSFDLEEFKANFMPTQINPGGVGARRPRREVGMSVDEFKRAKEHMTGKMQTSTVTHADTSEPTAKRARRNTTKAAEPETA
jgi:hypothetical protein